MSFTDLLGKPKTNGFLPTTKTIITRSKESPDFFFAREDHVGYYRNPNKRFASVNEAVQHLREHIPTSGEVVVVDLHAADKIVSLFKGKDF
jgi:hypothetical protein